LEKSARDLCSDAERVYCENYVISLSKTEAAEAMGSEAKSLASIGWQVYQRPHVRAYIEQLLDESTTTAKETLKLMKNQKTILN
jgi:phage terminase small subunit